MPDPDWVATAESVEGLVSGEWVKRGQTEKKQPAAVDSTAGDAVCVSPGATIDNAFMSSSPNTYASPGFETHLRYNCPIDEYL